MLNKKGRGKSKWSKKKEESSMRFKKILNSEKRKKIEEKHPLQRCQ